jgi:hypothetical protein
MIVGTEVRVCLEIEKTRELLTLDFDFQVCGSDLHAFLQAISTLLPFDTPKKALPVTMGHEFVFLMSDCLIASLILLRNPFVRFSGTIVEVGPDVDPVKWSVGTNVVV